jgi:hypothetical protein
MPKEAHIAPMVPARRMNDTRTLPVLAAAPRKDRDHVLDCNPQMVSVPRREGFRIIRLEENATDARDTRSALSNGHAPD